MERTTFAGVITLVCALSATTAMAQDAKLYADFPITVPGYSGSKTTSVSYTGQIARHTLHDTLKNLANSGNGQPNPALMDQMLAYYSGKNEGRAIGAPATKGEFVVLQTNVDEISSGKDLAGKTFKGAVTGMPDNMTGPELVQFWIDKASSANKGYDTEYGYQYGQLISKFIMGAVFFNQAVDVYLDENLTEEVKPNNVAYSDGAAYTGKEHSWDEAFGYFGAPAHALSLPVRKVYEINKLGTKSAEPAEAFAAADFNNDGTVDLKTEMAFTPSYYASGFDSGSFGKTLSETAYFQVIVHAFYDGRQIIAEANGAALSDAQRNELEDLADTIRKNWQRVLAEATFRYAGLTYKDMVAVKAIQDGGEGDLDEAVQNYINHWSELKGFSLALQSGRDNLGESAALLNQWIGFGPVLLDQNQVVGIDSNGDYVTAQGPSWGDYQVNLLNVQKQLIENLGVQARTHDVTDQIAGLVDGAGTGLTSEND